MTNEDILKLAETCGFDTFVGEKDDGTNCDYWECWEDQLLKFALLIHENGYNKGYDDSKSSSFKGFHNCLDD
jgi:hypothetical protein